jgi:hypothetical protein
MWSCCKSCQIYRGSCSMGQQPVMWTNIILRKSRVHLRYKGMVLKVAMQEEALPRRPNMEPRGMPKSKTHLKNPLVKEHKAPRNCPTVRLVHILRGEERGESTPRVVTLKNLRNPSHPLLMGKSKRGKKQKLGYLV